MAGKTCAIELEIEVPEGLDPKELAQDLADVLATEFPGGVEISIPVRVPDQPSAGDE